MCLRGCDNLLGRGGGGILLPAKGGVAGRGSSWERKLVWPNDASWCIL